MEKTKNRIETIQGVQYSVRNQTFIKRISAFFFHHIRKPPGCWQRSSFSVNHSFINKIRRKLGAAIDPTEVRWLSCGGITAQWARGCIALLCKNSRLCSSRICQQLFYCFSCKNARFNIRTMLFTLSNFSSSSSISFLPEENR